jgi:hypothetical protein
MELRAVLPQTQHLAPGTRCTYSPLEQEALLFDMAHFAELDNNSVVVRVIVGVDAPYDGEAIYFDETKTVWKRTSYNTQGGVHILGGTPFRKNYAGIGYTYDASRDAFIPPKPYNSWTLDEGTCLWQAPTPMPSDGKMYDWDEATQSWFEVTL